MLGSRNSVCFTHRIAVALIAVILVAAACGETNNNSAGSSPSNAADSGALVSLMRRIGWGIDYDQTDSPAILAGMASLTVVGTVTNVADGRVFGDPGETEPRFLNVGGL